MVVVGEGGREGADCQSGCGIGVGGLGSIGTATSGVSGNPMSPSLCALLGFPASSSWSWSQAHHPSFILPFASGILSAPWSQVLRLSRVGSPPEGASHFLGFVSDCVPSVPFPCPLSSFPLSPGERPCWGSSQADAWAPPGLAAPSSWWHCRSRRKGSCCPTPRAGLKPGHPTLGTVFLGGISKAVAGKAASFSSVLKLLAHLSTCYDDLTAENPKL